MIDNIIIDGDLNDWNDIPYSDEFVVHNTGNDGTQSTKMKLAWDSDNLYIAYQVIDTDIKISSGNQDAKIFNSDDLVEFFIDPDGNGLNYIEVGINGNNVYYDYIIKCPGGSCGTWSDDQVFDLANFESKASFSGTANNAGDQNVDYQVEIKIPFISLNTISNGGFTTPVNQDIWSANFFRIDRNNTNSTTEYQSWNPHNSFGYHQPTKFGTVTFKDDNVTAIDYSITDSGLSFFPNPSTGMVNFTETVDQVTIFDIMGNLVMSIENTEKIDLSNYQSGIYTISIYNNNNQHAEKLILE